jgi:flagellar basal-body rod protein FlgC
MALFGALDAASSGLSVSRIWLDAISDNVANINTMSRTDQEGFRSRMVVISSRASAPGEPGGAEVTRIVKRGGDLEEVYDPSHPLADENGIVLGSNVDLSIEMTDMIIAQRAYQANVKMIEVATDTYRAGLRIGQR